MKTCSSNKELYPFLIIESILPISSFTLFALFLSLGGSSEILINNGSGIRYIFPIYSTCLIIALIYLTILNNENYLLRKINIERNLSFLIKIIIILWLIIGFRTSEISIRRIRDNPLDWWCLYSRPSISDHIRINSSNRKDQIRGMPICPLGWYIPK